LTEFVLLGALWGASFLFMRLGAAEFGALPTAGMRVAIAALFLLPLLLLRGQWQALSKHWGKIFFLGMLNSGIPFALYAYALLSISTGLSSLLNATVPLFGALVAWLWLKDRPHGMKILGLLIGFVGVAMLAWGKASFKPDASGLVTGWAVLACLGACLCYGISASFTKRHLGGVPSLESATQPHRLAGPAGRGRVVHRCGLCAVFPPDRQGGRGRRADRHLFDPGLCRAVRRGISGRIRDGLDADLRYRHFAGYRVVDGAAEIIQSRTLAIMAAKPTKAAPVTRLNTFNTLARSRYTAMRLPLRA